MSHVKRIELRISLQLYAPFTVRFPNLLVGLVDFEILLLKFLRCLQIGKKSGFSIWLFAK